MSKTIICKTNLTEKYKRFGTTQKCSCIKLKSLSYFDNPLSSVFSGTISLVEISSADRSVSALGMWCRNTFLLPFVTIVQYFFSWKVFWLSLYFFESFIFIFTMCLTDSLYSFRPRHSLLQSSWWFYVLNVNCLLLIQTVLCRRQVVFYVQLKWD